ncbi:50S ribosomal protein L15 [Candidatus Woesebacteria bacterium RIFCSPHIGHO2_02_FULL_38_9]|uniref:Large ribosomal subunit protein uL15 n=1 Tax=Candidatus Woesebacteria bacterium RIFCSPHIGHO2_01_FULL_39_28 TaxID=1802496 RepID=A0A1F7YAL6_9BACT|nr:MAG: 50S ribosomal protein L15 [Candidatus Woesebacteria bacterium RIFCSPHIGHO2_01_FULL_39_28]OGM32235.1 MAG: 50S ribosomal protein L15 [Candidatus Woesebacteria bacterium RIFCSPHIGHO2_02_FULL_38_9]OGM58458.1 MAG: 50S ribosomal protein L15 [Candidatus Woesebacteria bacterium RIFCSPLOWO2_01_FULL_38_20]
MNNINLPKVVIKRPKRLGRGYGSGKGGHTVGRGQKGQKSRRNLGILFEGVKIKKSLLRRLPIQRGKSKFKSKFKKPLIINIELLNLFENNLEVTLESLAKANIVKLAEAKKYGVKILGNGNLTKKLKVFLPTSKPAREKILKAGGQII